MQRQLSWALVALAPLALLLGACGGSDLVSKQRAATDAAVRQAQQFRAAEEPMAADHLTVARDEVEKADRLAHGGHNIRAHNMLARAQADADLATAQAQSGQATRLAQQSQQRLESLQQQIQQIQKPVQQMQQDMGR
jgi:hypothetical protein